MRNSRENHENTNHAVGEVTEISHEKLPPMPEKSAFMFRHNFYSKSKMDLKDPEISKETRKNLLTLQKIMMI